MALLLLGQLRIVRHVSAGDTVVSTAQDYPQTNLIRYTCQCFTRRYDSWKSLKNLYLVLYFWRSRILLFCIIANVGVWIQNRVAHSKTLVRRISCCTVITGTAVASLLFLHKNWVALSCRHALYLENSLEFLFQHDLVFKNVEQQLLILQE